MLWKRLQHALCWFHNTFNNALRKLIVTLPPSLQTSQVACIALISTLFYNSCMFSHSKWSCSWLRNGLPIWELRDGAPTAQLYFGENYNFIVQESFLAEIGIDDVTALCNFNLAPLSLRRDIAMLGLIHRTALGQGPPHFQQWLYREKHGNRRSMRHRGHELMLHEYRNGTQLNIVKRSALGLCSGYNLLPADIVEANSVKCFQGLLQDLARDCACRGVLNWQQFVRRDICYTSTRYAGTHKGSHILS